MLMVRLTPADLETLVQEGEGRAPAFDRSPCPRFRYPEDFDRKKFDTWLGYSRAAGRLPVEDALVGIGAAERAGRKLLFRNAGVLFFAKNVRDFFPEACIRYVLGKGRQGSCLGSQGIRWWGRGRH